MIQKRYQPYLCYCSCFMKEKCDRRKYGIVISLIQFPWLLIFHCFCFSLCFPIFFPCLYFDLNKDDIPFDVEISFIVLNTYKLNSFREGLMSYKQFIQELEDDILPAEAERRWDYFGLYRVWLCSIHRTWSFEIITIKVAFDFVDTKNTSRSIFQLRSEYFLMLIKMRNGTSRLSLYSCFVHFVVLTICALFVG